MNKYYFLFSLLAILPLLILIPLSNNSAADDVKAEGMKGSGHYTIYVKDSMGATTQIRQSPNAVVNSGENCMAKMLFGSDGGDQVGVNVCIGQISQGFRYMGLDEDAQILVIDKDLRDQADETGLTALAKAGITWNQNSTGSDSSTSKVTLRLSNIFTNSGVGSETIVAVGLFNDTGKDIRSMLSKANFTGVSVGVSDTLTVNYDFEVGGGTVP